MPRSYIKDKTYFSVPPLVQNQNLCLFLVMRVEGPGALRSDQVPSIVAPETHPGCGGQ